MTARTIDEIFSDILTTKESLPDLLNLVTNVSDEQTLLTELTTDSLVARWVLYAYVIATCIYAFELILQDEVTEVEAIRDSAFAGNPTWYVYQAKKFQYGDEIVCDESTDFIPKYSVIDESKQIIKNCGISDTGGKVIFKIQGKESNILTEDQISSFSTYIDRIKFAGTKKIIQNVEADKIKIVANIIYSGVYKLDDIKSNVEAAILDYISNIEFDSVFVTNYLIDKVQSVPGVKDMEINTIESKAYNEPGFTPIVHRKNSQAGYFEVDVDYPLSTYITYQIS